MMKRKNILFVLSVIVLSLVSCETKSEEIIEDKVSGVCNCNDVFLDPEYNYFYTDDRTVPFSGKCESKYSNGQLKEEKNYLNGKLDGKYLEYYESGAIKSEWFFSVGRQHGESKGYFENGSLKYHSNFYKGEHDTTFVSDQM